MLWVWVGFLVLLGVGLSTWAVVHIWQRGDRLWAVATVIIPAMVTWSMWVIASQP